MQRMRSNQRDGHASGVLDRAVALLDSFGVDDDELSVGELARRTDMAKSTTHRLAAELVRLGLLEKAPGGLRIGLRMFELGQLVPLRRSLRETATPVLADLHAASGATVHFAVLDGAEVVYLEIVTSERPGRLPSRVGGRFPAHATAVGKAILAYSPPAVVRAIVERGLERRTPHTIVMPGALTRELAATAQRGIAYEHEESALGVTCVACPVFGPHDQVAAAISISERGAGSTVERFVPAVRTAALTLTRQLGGTSAITGTG